MKVSYFGGLVQHLLSAHPDVAKVETLADAGIEGPNWHPDWLKVTFTNGTSMVLSVVRTASENEAPDKPDTFDLGDLDGGRQMSGVRGAGHG
ncbi:hypothetical protein K1W54_29755 [Micromonospora sp. CPCC 205371]|nr:hypothetical protein [Micromonospora sp. CPCC 205371]